MIVLLNLQKTATQYHGNISNHCTFWKLTQKHQEFDYAISSNMITYGSPRFQKVNLAAQVKKKKKKYATVMYMYIIIIILSLSPSLPPSLSIV